MQGPAQPYIARNVGADSATISLQWSVHGMAWMLGSVAASAVFKRAIPRPRNKVGERGNKYYKQLRTHYLRRVRSCSQISTRDTGNTCM